MRRQDKNKNMKRVNILFEQRNNSLRLNGGELNESNPCWDGYEQVGMKNKDGKEVPNCIPKTNVSEKIKHQNINEYEIFPYKDRNNKYAEQNADRLKYSFDANGIGYNVGIWHDSRSHNFGEYEVEFGVSEQKHAGDRVGRDIKHLNSVLYTVFTIVEDAVKKFKIKNIKLEGARDEKDNSNAFFKGSIRSKLYLRFINSKYPSDAVKQMGPWIYIDMTRVYPDIVGNNDNIDKLTKILVNISDEDPDIERIKRGFYGLSEDNFNFGGELFNSTMGGMEMTIYKDYGEYEVTWNLYEDDEETTSNGGLKTIDDIIYFLRRAFGV